MLVSQKHPKNQAKSGQTEAEGDNYPTNVKFAAI